MPRQFLARHWQKKPLLIRQALPGFKGPLSRAGILRLAASTALESRLVIRKGSRWTLAHGPMSRSMLAELPARNWTLLVQGLNHVLPAADALLNCFDFIPRARMDDVMVSYAAPGGGVGPHLDSYDVFLLQGAGRRRWRIGVPADTGMRPDAPLKILRHFTPEQEWLLEPGDMLYLPPGYAHEGVALDACFTYSIGFRAPSHQELSQRFLDYLHDQLAEDGRLQDPGLRPVRASGALPHTILVQTEKLLRKMQWNRPTVIDFLGRDLTEPKPHVVFLRPLPLTAAAFAKALTRHGVRLDPKSLLLYAGARFYLNGEPVDICGAVKSDIALLRQLANRRRLASGARGSAALHGLLRSWYRYGFVHIGSDTQP